MLKKIIVKLFDLLDYSIIKKKKLTKIDVERKHYKHQLDKLNFIFLNVIVSKPSSKPTCYSIVF